MRQTFDPVCFDAFTRLLARPDPGDLPQRAHVYRYEGDPDRRTTRLPAILMGWLQRRHLEVDIAETFLTRGGPVHPAHAPLRSLASATPTLKRHGRPANPGLRVLCPTGTG